jgi:hypothetical protein
MLLEGQPLTTHTARAKMRARKVNLLHPTHKASRNVKIARQPNAGEQMFRGAARHDRDYAKQPVQTLEPQQSAGLGKCQMHGCTQPADTSTTNTSHTHVHQHTTLVPHTHPRTPKFKFRFFANRYAAAKLGVNMKFNSQLLGVPKLFLSLNRLPMK